MATTDPTYRADLVAQIVRDVATLRLPDALIAPSRQFYEERIAAYRQAVRELDAEKEN